MPQAHDDQKTAASSGRAAGTGAVDPGSLSTDDLRRQVAVLSAALGLREPLWDVPPVVREHVRQGEIVKAVKELRRGVPGKIGLLEAKRMVDALGDAPA